MNVSISMHLLTFLNNKLIQTVYLPINKTANSRTKALNKKFPPCLHKASNLDVKMLCHLNKRITNELPKKTLPIFLSGLPTIRLLVVLNNLVRLDLIVFGKHLKKLIQFQPGFTSIPPKNIRKLPVF